MSAPRGGPRQQGVSQRSLSAPRARPARSKRRSGQRREGRIESSASSENEAATQVGPWASSYDEFGHRSDAGLVVAASPELWDDALGLGLRNGTAHGPVPLLRRGRSAHRHAAESAHRRGEGLGQGWCDDIIAERATHGGAEDRDLLGRARATHGRGDDRDWFAVPVSRNRDERDADSGFDPIPISTLAHASTAPKVIRYRVPFDFEAPCPLPSSPLGISVLRGGIRD